MPDKSRHLKNKVYHSIVKQGEKKIALNCPTVRAHKAIVPRRTELRARGNAEEFVTDSLGLAYTTCLQKYITDSLEA